jgi:hypothetical protein
MRREEADGHAAASQPHCEIEKALLEEECERPGEVSYREMLLCRPHAALLGVEERVEGLLGTMFMIDKWMEENGSSAADEEYLEEYLGRIRHEREEVVAALRLTRLQLRSARKVFSVGS